MLGDPRHFPPRDLRRLNAAFFTVNGVIAVVFLGFVLADALIEKLGGDSLAEMKPRFDALRQAVDDEWAGAFDEVVWQVTPAAEKQAQAMPPLTAEVLFYAPLRFAVSACLGLEMASPFKPVSVWFIVR